MIAAVIVGWLVWVVLFTAIWAIIDLGASTDEYRHEP